MAKKAAFKLSENRRPRRRPPLDRSARVPEIKSDEERGPFFIRGQKAGSRDEYWVSLALEKIEEATGWGWEYQVPVYGGRMRGGNVVDFLVYTPGRWTILEPMGRYWHTGVNEDRQQMERVARRKNWNLIAWFTDETPTRDSVMTLLRRELNVV